MPAARHEVVFLSAVRTGFGAFGGALKDLTATDLGTHAAREALARSGLPAAQVDHVIVGNALQTSADAIYLARHVALRAGCRIETPAVTVNRLCGSGFEAVIEGARQILLGESKVVLCGGAESMSQAPHVARGARWGYRFGQTPALEDTLWEALRDPQCGLAMAETAEALAVEHGITRADCDAYALRSQQGAAKAWADGRMADEVIPVPLRDRKSKQETPWADDEHRRPDTTLAGLAKLPPVFKKEGVVTAGNASGISDGAAMLVLAHADVAKAAGLKPLGRLVSWGLAGVDPGRMGIGPVPATRIALADARLALDAMDRIEINEAFAAQYLAVERTLGLDRAKTNVEGGAIALGHPLAASGARLTTHLLHALRRRQQTLGLGAACIGGGQGAAVVLEAFPS
ncbi:MAG TPA: acetyl-CoA C-acyltransferase [Gemmatimonadales bacterium]|nr:acetyl-CoA C-acyltransferase [Gemmatimonadales bacterium]